MRDRSVATRYAGALLTSAKEIGVHVELAESYASVLEVMAANPDLVIFLDSPQVAEAEKIELLHKVFGGKVEPVLVNFFRLLIDKNRIEHFRDIGEQYAALVEADLGIVRAQVTTAVELPQDLSASLEAKLAEWMGAKIIMEKKVDTTVLGGVCVTMENRILDGTVRAGLEGLRKQLAMAPVR